jgi:acetylornithine deacetylase/succinyl-diaminopimelate desuccinylase-like protein
MSAKLLEEIEGEVTSLLSDLIKIDTTNPPGNEIQAARFLAKTLEKDDFECEILESAPGRGNLITRLEGTGEKPSLLLLNHLDVVAANPKEWSVDPFSGLVKDGFVWGRGAMDMKSMTAMEVMVLKLLKRNGVKLKGDVILAATADEERGGEYGAGWLVKNHPEKVRADYVINEGGGQAIPIDGKNVFTIQTAEKGILWFKVRAKGSPGHGSVPGAADNAILRMNKVVDRLGNHRAKITLTPTVREFLAVMAESREISEALRSLLPFGFKWLLPARLSRRAIELLFKSPAKFDEVLDRLAQRDKAMAEEIRAMLRMTIAPTIIHGGVKENIIPSECEAVFDCRILPGQTPDDALNYVRGLLADIGLDKLEFEVIQASEPSESPTDTPLYRLMVETLKQFDPNCAVTPILLTGGTDSRFFRKMGAVCYGFQPALSDLPFNEIVKMIHGVDERISIKNLVFGTSVLYHVVKKFLT